MIKNCLVSVIIPIRNEEKHIEKCLDSLIAQTYPRDLIEIIFVDGMSDDNTINIIYRKIEETDLNVVILSNPKKIVPSAMNIGIKNCNGSIVIRMDAHSSYYKKYIQLCVNTLNETGADNAGGVLTTVGNGIIGSAFARVLSSKFGVGNSGFRTNASSGLVDTVPFGAYPKETFLKYGFYDERLIRNQDYELNYRIRKNGGKIYLNSNIKLTYYCRDTFKSIVKQSYENGKWNYITMKLCPGSMGIRHFIPFVFFISLLIMPFFSEWLMYLFIMEIISYLALDIYYSTTNNVLDSLVTMILYPIFHMSYGLGTFFGLLMSKK